MEVGEVALSINILSFLQMLSQCLNAQAQSLYIILYVHAQTIMHFLIIFLMGLTCGNIRKTCKLIIKNFTHNSCTLLNICGGVNRPYYALKFIQN